jgi:hypothetical protein
MWHRVFCRSQEEPPIAALAAHLHHVGLPVEPHFSGDDLGWTRGELRLPGAGTPVFLQRYLTDEDNLRDDLNSHAAELETCDYSPNNTRLMEHVVQSRQLITLRKPIDVVDEPTMERLLEESCRFLASWADGVYQIDGKGWIAPDGTLLLQEY